MFQVRWLLVSGKLHDTCTENPASSKWPFDTPTKNVTWPPFDVTRKKLRVEAAKKELEFRCLEEVFKSSYQLVIWVSWSIPVTCQKKTHMKLWNLHRTELLLWREFSMSRNPFKPLWLGGKISMSGARWGVATSPLDFFLISRTQNNHNSKGEDISLKTKSSPLKIGRFPKGKDCLPTNHFQVLC